MRRRNKLEKIAIFILLVTHLSGCIFFASKAIRVDSSAYDVRLIFEEIRKFMEQNGFSETYYGKAIDLQTVKKVPSDTVVGLYKHNDLSVDVYYFSESQQFEILINEHFTRSFSESAQKKNQELVDFLEDTMGSDNVTVLRDQ